MRIAIINVSGFWKLGWATTPATQQPVIDALKRANIMVDVYEVDSEATLLAAIHTIKQSPCLVWANAYALNQSKDSDEQLWLAKILAEHQLLSIGSNDQALQNVLLKHQCQTQLTKAGVAVAKFTAVDQDNIAILDQLLLLNQLEFPLFVKPNALSSSMGITQDCIVYDKKALIKQINLLGSEFGFPVMVEEFLPSDDITVAVFNSGEEQLLLATYYTADNHDGKPSVLDRADRLQNWGGSKQMRLVEEPHILAQIPGTILPACKALGIDDVTRIDCRLDRHGKLKIFDVNGLPGLEYPDSVTVWQMITKFSKVSWIEAFDVLIYLIIYCAAKRHQQPIPPRIDAVVQQYRSAFDIVTASTTTY